MILETLENMKQYKGINSGIDKILEIYKQYTAENFVAGRVDIEGDTLYLNFAKYETTSPKEAKFEAHRKYIDVMYMVEGCETIYVKNVNKLSNITDEYNPEIDALFADFEEDTTSVRLEKGDVVILFPQDAHIPACIADNPCSIKKIIGKVRVETRF